MLENPLIVNCIKYYNSVQTKEVRWIDSIPTVQNHPFDKLSLSLSLNKNAF